MSFVNPQLLWLLLAVPAVGGWTWWRRRRTAGLRYSDIEPVRGAPVSWTVRLWWLPAALRMGALALGIVALARPQTEETTRTRTAEGIDIVMVLDASTSMQADDFQPTRFEAAREAAGTFVEGRVSDRVGLIVFAAEAYTQVPLTLDYSFLQRMLDDVEIGAVEDGTAVGTALATAVNRLKDSEADSKVAILLTDGRNNRGQMDPRTAAEVAQTMGVRVYAIGVGSSEDTDAREEALPQGPRDESAGVDAEMLRAISSSTGGRYFSATNRDALDRIYAEIDTMEATPVDERVYTDRTERYPWFLLPALGLVLLEVGLSATLFRRFP
ncbi:vWA domain-containing protein [Salinibacter altiplanensis]|uniref:vWA domain-containing protein n=1 Tax=Salinibacter altiplanensis TaxID=1803181 RepID=UPI000C9ECB9C|nr:VWA domain-containing protein [Salinibacter altiplanensis]